MKESKKHFETKAMKKAQELGETSTEQDMENIDSNLGKMKKGVIAKIWDKVLFLWEQAKSPDVPLRLKLTIVGALLYLILPIDVIPDSLPGIGLIDDMSVLLLVFKEVSNYVIPKTVEKLKKTVEESIFKKLDAKLNKDTKQYLIYSLIVLCINSIGFLVLIFKPFDNDIPKIIAKGVFSICIVWSFARFVNMIYKRGKVIKSAAKSVIKKRNLREGVYAFILEKYPLIAKVYAGIEVAQHFIPSLESVPDIDEIANDFIAHYKKRAVITVIVMVAYSAMIFGIKLLLLNY